MSTSTYVRHQTYGSSPSASRNPDMSWVPPALAVLALLVVTVMVTDTGEDLRFAE